MDRNYPRHTPRQTVSGMLGEHPSRARRESRARLIRAMVLLGGVILLLILVAHKR